MIDGMESILFAFGVKINSTDSSFYLIETDIIEPFKARSGDLPYPMIGH